jgi:hypothetical protein
MLVRYNTIVQRVPAPHFLDPADTLPKGDERFFHLKEVSRGNLSSLLESELNVDGEWAHQFAEEEELDVTLQQLLADANCDSKFSIIVSEEGQGKTALLRYIWRNLPAILATTDLAGKQNLLLLFFLFFDPFLSSVSFISSLSKQETPPTPNHPRIGPLCLHSTFNALTCSKFINNTETTKQTMK